MSHMLSSSLRTVMLLLISGLFVPRAIMAEADVFGAFTAHIHHQVQADKRTFVTAQSCTEWFYRQLQKKPPKAIVEGVSFQPGAVARSVDIVSDCTRRYPGGIEAARKDFSETQSSLSVSLTFYEFALVGDRNDDARYNEVELRDMLESFGLPFNEVLPASAHLAVLNAKFDRVHLTIGLDALMTGMGILYDRGYRFTAQDRAALDRIAG